MSVHPVLVLHLLAPCLHPVSLQVHLCAYLAAAGLAQRHNEQRLNEAFRSGASVMLIFSYAGGGQFDGYAQMTSMAEGQRVSLSLHCLQLTPCLPQLAVAFSCNKVCSARPLAWLCLLSTRMSTPACVLHRPEQPCSSDNSC